MEKLNKFNQLTEFMEKHEVFYNINISLKNNYAYFETAKAACTTIKRTLMNLELSGTNYRPKKVHLDVFSTPFIKLFQLDFMEFIRLMESDHLFKFCFVRNPYARILSCYLDKIVGNKPQKIKILRLLGLGESELEKEIKFDEFLDLVGQQNPKEMDQHWRPQYMQLFGGLIEFDYVGRVESLKEDLIEIEKMSGCQIMKHHEDVFWHRTDSDKKIADYFTSKIAKKVQAIYACDFEHFGYSPKWRKL